MEYYASIGKDEYPTFVSTWMGLKEIMLSEISQAERVNYHMVSLICGAKGTDMEDMGRWREVSWGKLEGRRTMRDGRLWETI